MSAELRLESDEVCWDILINLWLPEILQNRKITQTKFKECGIPRRLQKQAFNSGHNDKCDKNMQDIFPD